MNEVKFDESKQITIDENTKLLDVLADEFEIQGNTTDVDINGFQEINGLNVNREKTKASGGRSQKAAVNQENRE